MKQNVLQMLAIIPLVPIIGKDCDTGYLVFLLTSRVVNISFTSCLIIPPRLDNPVHNLLLYNMSVLAYL